MHVSSIDRHRTPGSDRITGGRTGPGAAVRPLTATASPAGRVIPAVMIVAAVIFAVAAWPSAIPGGERSPEAQVPGSAVPDVEKPGVETPSAEMPGEEISVPEGKVTDRFFGYLIGLVDANKCGVVDGAQLQKVLKGHLGKTSIPFETIEEIRRECAQGSAVRDITIIFTKDLDAPVPYSILGYHPGSVAASETVKFLEWYMPSQKISVGREETVELSDVFVFGVYEGWAVVDIDAWIDRILGGFLDDTRIVMMALFKYNGEWHGLAGGYGRSGEGRSGIFNFQTNKILFPTPRELRGIAPYLRSFVVRTKRLESPMPPGDEWKPAAGK